MARKNLRLSKELGNKLIAIESLEGLACTVGTQGEAQRTAKLLGVVQALRESVGYQQSPSMHAVREPYLGRGLLAAFTMATVVLLVHILGGRV